MSQANNFGFGEEAALLKESARKLFAEQLPVARLHALVAADPDPDRVPEACWDRSLWQQMVALGWTMLAVPESAGGIGMPLAAVAGLASEVGRAAVPCPMLGTLNASFVLAACGAGGGAALADIAAGEAATLAITNRYGSWRAGDTELAVTDGVLSGTAWFVQDARKVSRFLVSARTEAGLGLFWVRADAPGVSIVPDAIIDLTRDQGHVSFDAVTIDGDVACELTGNGLPVLYQALPAVWTLLAADMTGAAEWQLQTTVEYASTRQQFGHPLGFFQAVKHPLVDVMLQLDAAVSLVYNAASAFDAEPESAHQYAHMAKAAASDVAGFAASRSVQYHGGIGFTWECFVHLYFKRQKHSQMLWGDGSWHRAQLAEILLGNIA